MDEEKLKRRTRLSRGSLCIIVFFDRDVRELVRVRLSALPVFSTPSLERLFCGICTESMTMRERRDRDEGVGEVSRDD